MKELLQNLLVGLDAYLNGSTTLEEVEHTLTTPIIADESHDELPDTINDILYKLDMWEIENLSRDEIIKMKKELGAYIETI